MTNLHSLLFIFALFLGALPAAAATVLATNGEVTVTSDDFEAEMLRMPKEQRHEFRASGQRIAKVVENLLTTKTLAAAARKNGIDRNPLVRQEIELNAEKVLARWERERLEEAIVVPDLSKRAREVFLANPGKYTIPAYYRTSHILVDMKCRTREAALARASEARKEVLGGLDFAAAVARYSDDPTAARNKGNLDAMPAEGLVPEYIEAVRKLKPGELSEPVVTQFGVHVIRLVETTPAVARRFEEVQAVIVEELRQEFLRTKSDEISAGIRTDPAIKVNSEAIDALKTRVGAPPEAAKPR